MIRKWWIGFNQQKIIYLFKEHPPVWFSCCTSFWLWIQYCVVDRDSSNQMEITFWSVFFFHISMFHFIIVSGNIETARKELAVLKVWVISKNIDSHMHRMADTNYDTKTRRTKTKWTQFFTIKNDSFICFSLIIIIIKHHWDKVLSFVHSTFCPLQPIISRFFSFLSFASPNETNFTTHSILLQSKRCSRFNFLI